MEYPYPDLPDVPRISLLDPDSDHGMGPGSPPESQWHKSAHDALIHGLQVLRQDHKSGAKELATRALGVLLDVAKIVGSSSSTMEDMNEREMYTFMEYWSYAVRKSGWVISRYGRPSMGAAISSAIVKTLRRVADVVVVEGGREQHNTRSSKTDILPTPVREGIMALQGQLQSREDNSGSEVGAQLRKFMRDRFVKETSDGSGDLEIKVLTLSSSSTIRAALGTVLKLELEAARARQTQKPLRIDLRIMESRPLCEGVSMAQALVNAAEEFGYVHMLRIQIASDASVAMLARDVDIVLLGADRISGSGDVSNKIGSFPAVLCAKAMSEHALVVTVSEFEKVAKPGKTADHGEEDNDVAELTAAWESSKGITEARPGLWEEIVRVRNVYFEWVPAQYIHCYVCEDGSLTVEDVRKRSKLALEEENDIFSEFDSGILQH
ncbi:hypothetical protein FQN54_009675 [Arachnomyces sp. PD_36]|nr:hypothetical protein FQN54_009675 [Arachnomyces sp. PD_36]